MVQGGVTPPLRLLSNIPSAGGEKIINQKEAEVQLKERGKFKRIGTGGVGGVTPPLRLLSNIPSAGGEKIIKEYKHRIK